MSKFKIIVHDFHSESLNGRLGISEERVSELEEIHQKKWDESTTITEFLQKVGESVDNINEYTFMILQTGAILEKTNHTRTRDGNDDSIIEAIQKLLKNNNPDDLKN